VRTLLIFGFVSLGLWAWPGVAGETRESLVAAVNAAPDKGSLTVVLARLHAAKVRVFFQVDREPFRLEAVTCVKPSEEPLLVENDPTRTDGPARTGSTVGAVPDRAGRIEAAISDAIRSFRGSPAADRESYTYTLPQLISLAPGFQWEKYFEAAGYDTRSSFQLRNPPVVRRLEEILVLHSLEELKAYVNGCIRR
jgi:hypothetical protein